MRQEGKQPTIPDVPRVPRSRLARRIGRAGIIASAVLGIHGSATENVIQKDAQASLASRQEDRKKSDDAYWRKMAREDIKKYATHDVFDVSRDRYTSPPIIEAYLDLYDSWKNKPFAEELLRKIAFISSEAVVKRIAMFKKA